MAKFLELCSQPTAESVVAYMLKSGTAQKYLRPNPIPVYYDKNGENETIREEILPKDRVPESEL